MNLNLPSGIIDASAYVGHQPGSVFLSSIQGNGAANAQLVVIVSPTVVEPMMVPVDSVAVVSGIQTGGSVADLVESDNVDLSIRRNSMQTAGVVEVEVKAFSPVTNPAFFEITVESAAFYRSAVVQSVELFDFEAGVFVEVDSRTASRFTDGVATASAAGDLLRFVEAGTACVTARIVYSSPDQRQAFSVAIDQISWTVQ